MHHLAVCIKIVLDKKYINHSDCCSSINQFISRQNSKSY